MSELTQHGRKALERCIREHQNFIRLADDYDLDEMSVQALQTAIESMQMRLDAAPNPAPGTSEHDESWAEMIEHDYDTAVRGAVISKSVEFTDSCGCVFCDLKCPHSKEDCKLIALLEDVAVQHEGLENYGDSCGPRMCIRACRGAIAALKATHPQPVTPAGGEVGEVVEGFSDGLGDSVNVAKWNRGKQPEVGAKLYTHPPVADAALPRGHRISDAKQNPMASALVRMEGLAIRWYESAQNDKHEQRASAKQKCAADLRALIAALNQRGGGV